MKIWRTRVLAWAVPVMLACLALGAGPAYASHDRSAPVVVSHTVTKTSLDVSSAGDALTFSVRISDETAVSDFVARIIHRESGQYHYFPPESLVSGTRQNGVWRSSVALPQGSAAGNWTIDVVQLSDTLSNATNGFLNLRSVLVKSVASPDVSGPVVVSHAVTKSTLDVSTASDTLTFSVRMSDATAVSDLMIRIMHEQSGQLHFFSPETLVLGTAQNGIWRADVTLPQGSAGGNWVIHVLSARDTLGNTSNFFGSVRTVVVKSVASPDLSAPVVVSHAVTKTTLDVTTGDAVLILSVRITDDTAVSDFAARMRHPESRQNHSFSSPVLVSGTPRNGVWRSTVTLPPGSASGSWDVEVFAIRDALTNISNNYQKLRSITVKAGM